MFNEAGGRHGITEFKAKRDIPPTPTEETLSDDRRTNNTI